MPEIRVATNGHPPAVHQCEQSPFRRYVACLQVHQSALTDFCKFRTRTLNSLSVAGQSVEAVRACGVLSLDKQPIFVQLLHDALAERPPFIGVGLYADEAEIVAADLIYPKVDAVHGHNLALAKLGHTL